jgi:RNA polymerase sigma-70 factor (ECF subfamily)
MPSPSPVSIDESVPTRDSAPIPDFDARVAPHLASMLRSARAILASEDLAWDAVQEVLLAVWRAGRLPAEPAGVLRRLVRLRSLHLRRGHDRRCRCEARARQLLDRALAAEDAAAELERREGAAALAGALAGLSAEHRAVLELCALEGLDYRAAAERLALPLGTVRSRLSRARSALRRRLGSRSGAAGAGLERAA